MPPFQGPTHMLKTIFHLLAQATLFLTVFTFPSHAAEKDADLFLIELEAFEVFSKGIKLVDGISGKEYSGDHPVVLGFRREFDEVLLNFHKRLLLGELHMVKNRAASMLLQIAEINKNLARFGIETVELDEPILVREKAIINRMIKDPFFRIDEIIVWDAKMLADQGNELPKNKYAANIRFNETTGKWERRIMTQWDVSYIRLNSNNEPRTFYTNKRQGLNLETKEGFHLIDGGLPGDIVPSAFKEVALQYPIVVDRADNIPAEIHQLKRDLVENLFYIYDPFSWKARGNTRFGRTFRTEIHKNVKRSSFKVTNRKWFDGLFSQLIADAAFIKHVGTDDLYETRILSRISQNRNQLGTDLDLLNWNKGEKRSVDYEQTKELNLPHVAFTTEHSARFIMIDAYRRYGDNLIDAIHARLQNQEFPLDPRDLVKTALEEVSGVSAEKYIPAAVKIQRRELEKFIPPHFQK